MIRSRPFNNTKGEKQCLSLLFKADFLAESISPVQKISVVADRPRTSFGNPGITAVDENDQSILNDRPHGGFIEVGTHFTLLQDQVLLHTDSPSYNEVQ